MKAAFLVGRVLFGGFFLQSGLNHLKDPPAIAPYAGSKGIPYPESSVVASGLLLALGGLSIMFGARPKIGALGLAGFLAVASGTMHDFWNADDPGAKQSDMIHFSKNVALLGACLALASLDAPWPASVDGCLD